MNRESAE
ncbi:hypothetical protein ZEAMMB73_Zm00001d034547 [Zea mays]|nr:hypothetical protein ZEAMMB73_Zm00001d034547 [Zea mays]